MAQRAGFEKVLVSGVGFEHVVYRSGTQGMMAQRLHVYIEGDGSPWIAGRVPAADPTSLRPLALELMAKDAAPALYLGRPCYLGRFRDPGCEHALWTYRRYSSEVVSSMVQALDRQRKALGSPSLVLIGYSGGGTLATLIAGKLDGVDAILTIAANLDTHKWTSELGYRPLEGSINPVEHADTIAHIPQLHLSGAEDRQVPQQVTRSFTELGEVDSLRVIPGFNHLCCWLDIWPGVLTSFLREVDSGAL